MEQDWSKVSPNKIGRQMEASRSVNITTTSRFSVLECEEENDDEEEQESEAEVEEGEVQATTTVSQNMAVEPKEPGSRVSLP